MVACLIKIMENVASSAEIVVAKIRNLGALVAVVVVNHNLKCCFSMFTVNTEIAVVNQTGLV